MKRFLIQFAVACMVSVSMADYVNLKYDYAMLRYDSYWEGGVTPCGSSTGLVTSAADAGADGRVVTGSYWYDVAVRQVGGYVVSGSAIGSPGGGLALRGGSDGSDITTIYEIEDTNTVYSSYTNLYISGQLLLWSQYGNPIEISLLSGHIEAGELKLSTKTGSDSNNGTINLRDGIFHAGTLTKGAANINFLADGAGELIIDRLSCSLASTNWIYFGINFETGTKCSLTFGARDGYDSAQGVFEQLVEEGRVSVDGVVETNADFFNITDEGTGSTICHIGALPGLTVINGTLYKDGAPYRAAGMNYCDLFQTMISSWQYDGENTRTLCGLRYLGERGIPFVRFWACGFWPAGWDFYFSDRDEWFSRLDMVVETAEESGVGLIPCLFWRWETYPELTGEYRDQLANPDSLTWQFMSNYVCEVVTRYKDSPAIWGWEFCNELNLDCDLPNWDDPSRWTENPDQGVEGPATDYTVISNKMTYAIAEAAYNIFAQEVRRYDTHRFISSGNAMPQPYSWNNRMNSTYTYDTVEQAQEAFSWMQPPSAIDLASVHFYPYQPTSAKYAGFTNTADKLACYRAFCEEQNQAMFVGEWSSLYGQEELTLEEQRAGDEALLPIIAGSGADLVANWVFDYSHNNTTAGIVRTNNNYTWVLDLVLEYDARMRDETPASPAGVPLGWLDQYGIVRTGAVTVAQAEEQDYSGNGQTAWEDYYSGFSPLDSQFPFAITGFQLSGSGSLSWWGGTNGLMTPYVVQVTTNLADQAGWKTLGTKEREEGLNTFDGLSVSNSSGCFRILAVPDSTGDTQALWMPSVFDDGMVLQRGMPVSIWGKVSPWVEVTVEFNGQEKSTVSDVSGHWEVVLDSMSASSDSLQMNISAGQGDSVIEFSDVLIGDVWVLAGQSNMEYPLTYVTGGAEAAQQDYPWLRYFDQSPFAGACDSPAEDVVNGRWLTAGSGALLWQSAVGFFFAEALHPYLDDVPVALLETSKGGTYTECWIDAQTLEDTSSVQPFLDLAEELIIPGETADPDGFFGEDYFRRPAALYNGKVAPLQSFAVRGVLWYQGEANTATWLADGHAETLTALVNSWRRDWQRPDLPFLIVQLPRYDAGEDNDWPTVRAAQAQVAEELDGVELSVIIDCGEQDNIHPVDKLTVGERLALLARARVYGENVAYSGPVFQTLEKTDSALQLTFDFSDGLYFTNGVAAGFEICGSDGTFVSAQAEILSNGVVNVFQSDISDPAAVRYGWFNWGDLSLFNEENLPAAPFYMDSF